MSIPLEIREVLVCDDIRREDNGKAILIGVYVGDILVSAFPVNLRLSFWLQGRARKNARPGIAKFKIEVADQDEDAEPILVETKFDAPPTGMSDGVLIFAAVPLTVRQPGRLLISVDEGSNEWIELASKTISAIKPVNELAQPS
ncbi:hypothetical protein ACG33_04620 [Steroidobacter denitrificans]|uniref:Uncharacterized protein n=1 Tax=Steroidobacter denitrificans TaxID=465721 RepID=A0A127F9W6_STEDE|nr:hypothetical protein [Steroidobacter denitrificans]AMN46398.1 hypothetical protein ACG33_04620 [Steroidobacter denitrificans]